MLTTTYNYDDLGNVRSITDQHGNTSSYAYNDSWANGSCTPSGNGQAYVTQFTNRIEPERHLPPITLLGPSAGEKGPKRYQCWPIRHNVQL